MSMTPYVPEDHNGYNFSTTVIGELKYNYNLFKYDILANKTTELNYDVAITSMRSIYNYETKAYDAAVIGGYKMTDGLVTLSGNVGGSGGMNIDGDSFNYFVDSDMKIAYDMTGIFESVPYLYDLGNGKFFIAGSYSGNGYIIDNGFNVLRDNVWLNDIFLEDGLIRFSGDNGVGFTDMDGKVVIAPEYIGVGKFYGGVALANNLQGENVLLNKNGTVTKISDLEKSALMNAQNEVTTYNGFYSVETSKYDASIYGFKTLSLAYYANNGKLLKSFAHGNVSVINIGGSAYIKETVTDATTSEVKDVYYKFV